MELNMKLFNRLPVDVIMNEILPFTYSPQPKRLMNDVRSYYEDMDRLETMFYVHNDIIILNDLIRFCNLFVAPVYDITLKYENILRRHYLLKNITHGELVHFVFYDFHRRLLTHTSRKLRFLYGLLRPFERKLFYDYFYLKAFLF